MSEASCARALSERTLTTTRGSTFHADGRWTDAGRRMLVERIETGIAEAEMARQMGLAQGTAGSAGTVGHSATTAADTTLPQVVRPHHAHTTSREPTARPQE